MSFVDNRDFDRKYSECVLVYKNIRHRLIFENNDAVFEDLKIDKRPFIDMGRKIEKETVKNMRRRLKFLETDLNDAVTRCRSGSCDKSRLQQLQNDIAVLHDAIRKKRGRELYEMVDCDEAKDTLKDRMRRPGAHCEVLVDGATPLVVDRNSNLDSCVITCSDDNERTFHRGLAYVSARYEMERYKKKQETPVDQGLGEQVEELLAQAEYEKIIAEALSDEDFTKLEELVLSRAEEKIQSDMLDMVEKGSDRKYRAISTNKTVEQRIAEVLAKRGGRKISLKKPRSKKSRDVFTRRLAEAIVRRSAKKKPTRAKKKRTPGKRTAAEVCEASVRHKVAKTAKVVRKASGEKKLTKHQRKKIRDIVVKSSKCKKRLASKKRVATRKKTREKSAAAVRADKIISALASVPSRRTMVTRSMAKNKR